MKILPRFAKFSTITMLAVALLVVPNLPAATWGGGNGNWVSDNWGLNAPDGSPGDANYPSEAALLTSAGTLLIQSGDSITMGNSLFMSVSTVNQTGGSISVSGATRIRSNYTLNGGSLTTTGASYVETAGTLAVVSGTLNVSSSIEYGMGTNAINLSGGDVTIVQLRNDKVTTSSGSVTVTGSTFTKLQSTILVFADLGASASSNVNFVFDGSGVTPWSVIGGPSSLTLGTGINAANLSVNVSAMLSEGVAGVNLFDYGNAATVSGAFGTVAITDTTYGTLTLGTEGALNAGEYFLDYGGIGDTDVTLFYNTVPEPGTLALLGLGLLALPLRRRYQIQP